MKRKELALSLIKDNLISTKLVLGLNSLGLVADNYYLNLSETVLKVMGKEEVTDKDFGKIESMYFRVKDLDLEVNQKDLNKLSKKIYKEIKKI